MTNNVADHYLDVIRNAGDLIDYVQRNCLNNLEIPLDVRWQVYLEVEKYLPIYDYYGTDVVRTFLKDISFYDDLYVERHTTMLYSTLLERLGDDLDEDEEGVVLRFDIDEDSIKEAILKEGNGGFVYDW